MESRHVCNLYAGSATTAPAPELGTLSSTPASEQQVNMAWAEMCCVNISEFTLI